MAHRLTAQLPAYLMLGIVPVMPCAGELDPAVGLTWLAQARRGLIEHAQERLASASMALAAGNGAWASELICQADQALTHARQLQAPARPTICGDNRPTPTHDPIRQRTLNMSTDEADQIRAGEQARERLLKAAADAARGVARATAVRDEAFRAAHLAGISYYKIAKVSGMSETGVGKIARRSASEGV